MIEIGATKIVAIRKNGKTVMGPDQQPETKVMESTVQRVTRSQYGHNSKYSRRLIVKLHGHDTITIRPVGLRTEALIVVANIGNVYKDLLQRRLQNEALGKAREKKARLKEARARRSLASKERRFRKGLKLNA